MNRRDFITLLGGAAAWPLAARAQQQALPVIGYLGTETPEVWASRLQAFHQGLGETGYVDGRNVAIEYRWAEGQNNRLPALAADLMRSKVAVICAPGSTTAALAAKAVTQTIPIVFMVGTDPVQIGLVTSLNRPGGNLTGIVNLTIEVAAKRFEVLHELVPAATSLALLVNPANRVNAEALVTETQRAARSLGLDLLVLNASSQTEIEGAFATLVDRRVGGLSIGSDALFIAHSDQIIALADRHKVPTIDQFRDFTTAGGLVSYGPNSFDTWRLVGVYTGRILKGEKPADLPVQQSTKVELTINLKTAKALGINVPLRLLGRADEVIE
jgi:putative tryptophan/tyrosine transport system substrate-binding protein